MIKLPFQDIKTQKEFHEKGYVVMPFFNEAEIALLQSKYDTLIHDQNVVFESTSFLEDLAVKKECDDFVTSVFESKIEAVFQNYKPLGTSFLTKRVGAFSAMPIHQDWTVVDESTFASITCWVPLIDTHIENGAFQVIEGSHAFSEALRGPSLPVSFEGQDLSSFLKTIPLQKGEAIIFNHALIHASHQNLSDQDRVAVTFGLTHKDAALLMYYQKENSVEQWLMPDDMFLEYPNIRFEPKLGTFSKSFEYVVPQLTFETVKNKLFEIRKNHPMKSLFKNPEQQQFFEKNGYLLLPALQNEDISELKNLYATLGIKDEKGYGFHVGMDHKDKNIVAEMSEVIAKIALPRIEHVLEDVQLFTSSFVVKEPHPQGVVPPHQDWSFVENEEDYCSVTCWIPLQDVNMDNGCMGLLKGSNHFFNNHRPSPSPQVGTPLKKHMFTIFPFLELLEMKAGDALFFNNKTIHASPPNITDQTRLAIGLGFAQKEAQLRHYYLKPGTTDTLLKYTITPDFFLKYDNAQLSEMYEKGQFIEGYGEPEEVPYVFDDLSAEEFTKMIQNSGNPYNATLVGRMATLFNYNMDGSKKEEEVEEVVAESNEVVLHPKALPFWKIYTPLNVIREIKLRISKN
jgi:ectoine hydroxylase-related dioxygenase (phytanoyl-CoA dioxygenase family)